MEILVLSDTHGPRHWKQVPPSLVPLLERAELVLHAGDVCTPAVLDDLAAYGPLVVVRGNNDGDDIVARGAGEVWQETVEGVRIAMLHIAGAKDGRARRMHRGFPDADVVVFGHSHIPWLTEEVVDGHEFLLLNPGSPTDKRRQPVGTCAWLRVVDGRATAQIVELR